MVLEQKTDFLPILSKVAKHLAKPKLEEIFQDKIAMG
jgi:hypothetical protein